MIKLVGFIFALTLGFCLQVHAQEDGARRGSRGQQQGSSEQSRLDKSYQVNAQVFGVGPSLASVSGVQFGIFIDPNSLVLFEVTSGSSSASNFASTYKIKASSIGIHYKHFVSNSFYWRGGMDYRTATVDYEDTWFTAGNLRSFDGTSFALNFQIGNQWQWENFTMGVDWVGYSLPVTSSVGSEKFDRTSNYERTTIKNDEDSFLKNSHLNLLRLYLGMSF